MHGRHREPRQARASSSTILATPPGNEAVEGLRAQGIDARGAVFDVSSAAAVSDAVAAPRRRALVARCTGQQCRQPEPRPVVEQDPAVWQSIFDARQRRLPLRAVLPGMISQGGGRIIIPSSVAAWCMPGIAALFRRQGGALAAFTRALAGIRRPGRHPYALVPGFLAQRFHHRAAGTRTVQRLPESQVRWAAGPTQTTSPRRVLPGVAGRPLPSMAISRPSTADRWRTCDSR